MSKSIPRIPLFSLTSIFTWMSAFGWTSFLISGVAALGLCLSTFFPEKMFNTDSHYKIFFDMPFEKIVEEAFISDKAFEDSVFFSHTHKNPPEEISPSQLHQERLEVMRKEVDMCAKTWGKSIILGAIISLIVGLMGYGLAWRMGKDLLQEEGYHARVNAFLKPSFSAAIGISLALATLSQLLPLAYRGTQRHIFPALFDERPLPIQESVQKAEQEKRPYTKGELRFLEKQRNKNIVEKERALYTVLLAALSLFFFQRARRAKEALLEVERRRQLEEGNDLINEYLMK